MISSLLKAGMPVPSFMTSMASFMNAGSRFLW